MQLAYITIVYHQPEVLARAIKRLAGPETHFFIHVDKKSDITPFQKALKPVRANIHISKKRFITYRATWGICAALLHLMKQASDYAHFHYYMILPGDFYPIKSRYFILNFFKNLSRASQQYIKPVSNKGLKTRGIFVTSDTFRGLIVDPFIDWVPNNRFIKLHPLAKKIAIKARDKFLHPIEKRKIPFEDSIPYGLYRGNHWGGLTHPAVKYILYRAPEYAPYFKYIWNPDESFFHTILVNSPFREKIVSNHLTRRIKIGPPQPGQNFDKQKMDYLNETHWEKIQFKHIRIRLFLRRVSMRNPSCTRLLDRIDKEILGVPGE